jgi:hypothetical protein
LLGLVVVAVLTPAFMIGRAWFGGEHSLHDCMVEAGLEEGGSVHQAGWSWRPLGTRCEVTRPDGTTDVIVVDPW